MAATTVIQETNGASTGTPTTVSGVRFKHADTYDSSAVTTPMVKPGAGLFDRSWIKHLSLNCTNFSTSSAITNGKFYVSGAPTGFAFYCTTDASAYSAAGGDAPSGNDSTWISNPTAGGTQLSFLTTTFTGTGRIGQYVKVYLRLADTAGTGVQTGAQFTFQYDEV